MQRCPQDKPRLVSQCLELALLLEASANKPGNVSRTAGFARTRYEHFLASAVALSSPFERAAAMGEAVARREIRASAVGIGQIIKDCVMNVNAWQRGGNTLLGSAIMLSPIAAAAGMDPSGKGVFKIAELRQGMRVIVESTTPEDAVSVYEAIRAAKPGGLGESGELDINDPGSVDRILRERISLYDVFKIASGYDAICSEWVNDYPITFDVAYPSLTGQLGKNLDLNTAILQTFLEVLAEYPDTLIARKTSPEKACEVSSMSKEILLSGIGTSSGRKGLAEFDLKLRRSGNLLNPGTTADIIATALGLCILGGYRP